ncbi:MAG: AAA family ATPase, partial [Bacteroidales bacterium]|nr:AAA family ATPase [Bacteroidales bacterium]
MTQTPLELADKYINNTGTSVFLTGKAGTGKTTFLRHICQTTNKRCVVVAPTGVAAINANGVTIHSFFQLPFTPFLPSLKNVLSEYSINKQHVRKEKVEIIRTLDLLIIDEISMVRADLLDAIDDSLRRYRRSQRPFGGVQLLMIGDLQQLPPVVKDDEWELMKQVYPSPFFFNSKALQRTPFITIELKTIFRQTDSQFIKL